MNKPSIDSLTVMIPVYNEEGVIKDLVIDVCEKILPHVKHPELIVVNDGSKDSTLQILQSLQQEYPVLHIINHETNKGYGVSVMDGYQAAKGDYLFYMDGDNQINAGDFWKLWEQMQEHGDDVVTGARVQRIDHWHRHFLSKGLQQIVYALFHLYLKDINCPCKLFKKEALHKILNVMNEPSNISSTLMMITAHGLGLKVGEVDVRHMKRKMGTSYVSGIRMFTLSSYAIYELINMKTKLRKLQKAT